MKMFYQIVSNLRAIAELFIVPTAWLKYFSISLKPSQVFVFKEFTVRRGEGGKPSFYRPSSSSRIRAIPLLLRTIFPQYFQLTANNSLSQGGSPSSSVFHFEQGHMPYALACPCLRWWVCVPICLQHRQSHRSDSNLRLSRGFCVCVSGYYVCK